MKKKIKMISIPEPCHENWDKMTPVEKGRFCDACQKVVHDVTSFSDQKLSDLLNSSPNVCIQASSAQVDRRLKTADDQGGLLSRAAVVLGLISLTLSGKAMAQNKTMGAPVMHRVEPEVKLIEDSNEVILQGDVVIKEVEIELSGVVKDPDGQTINEARVTFNEVSVDTDKLGRFKVKLTVSPDEKIKVKVYKSPYVERSFYLDAKSQNGLEFKLQHYMLKGKVKKH